MAKTSCRRRGLRSGYCRGKLRIVPISAPQSQGYFTTGIVSFDADNPEQLASGEAETGIGDPDHLIDGRGW